jgi:hypothetical protein
METIDPIFDEHISEMVQSVIDTSADNTAGGIVNEWNIELILEKCWKFRDKLSPDFVDFLIEKYETSEGFLVKSADFIFAINKFKIR